MSALTGTFTTRAMAATVATRSGTGRTSPSGYPCDQATAALLVAMARAPALSMTRALPASHAFGRIRNPRSCRSRKTAAAAGFAGTRSVHEADAHDRGEPADVVLAVDLRHAAEPDGVRHERVHDLAAEPERAAAVVEPRRAVPSGLGRGRLE